MCLRCPPCDYAVKLLEYRARMETETQMSKRDTKQLRAIGHKLKPVVTVAGKGLSETVRLEIERALTDHELIKGCQPVIWSFLPPKF